MKNFTVDFIGIGSEKAGTTWVADQIAKHPDICLSIPKETFYFNRDNSYVYNTQRNKNFKKPLSWYEKKFSHRTRESVIGEFCTAYMHDVKAPQKIFQTFPEAKIILCVRNPIDRAYSAYWWHKNYSRKEDRNFIDVLANEPEYVERGLYAKHLLRYKKLFGSDRILIITMNEIKQNPEGIVERTLDFLGVDTNRMPVIQTGKSNASKRTRSKILLTLVNNTAELISDLGGSSTIEHALEKTGIKKMIQNILYKKQSYPQITAEERKRAYEFFQKDMLEFQKITGISFE